MNPEAVEQCAVKAIQKFCMDNPSVRITARQKHSLKFNLKDTINRLERKFGDPSKIPYEFLRVPQWVRHVRARPLDNDNHGD